MVDVPQLHFPSAYLLPTAPLVFAQSIEMPDGAAIATFVHAPAEKSLPEALAQGRSPVLLLHGNGEEHGIFGPTIDALCEAGHTVVAIDSRAQGRSTRGTAPLTYELMAADALAVLDHLGIASAHVVGFSDGAIEGLLIARDHPERALSLLSIGANLTPDGVDDSFEMEAIADRLSGWVSYWTEGEGAEKSVDTALLNPPLDEAARTAELLRASLNVISCPTTVMAGEFDEIDRAQTDLIFRSIPGATLQIVEGCGHTLPKEAPERVSEAALEVISRART